MYHYDGMQLLDIGSQACITESYAWGLGKHDKFLIEDTTDPWIEMVKWVLHRGAHLDRLAAHQPVRKQALAHVVVDCDHSACCDTRSSIRSFELDSI